MVASTFNMSLSPKQPYQFEICSLSIRLEHHDEIFNQLESKLDLLTQTFEKSPIYDQLKSSDLLLEGMNIIRLTNLERPKGLVTIGSLNM